jgi:hypothetical protein
MKELGVESAAIQLDARAGSAQHCLTWPDANRLEASVQDLWTSWDLHTGQISQRHDRRRRIQMSAVAASRHCRGQCIERRPEAEAGFGPAQAFFTLPYPSGLRKYLVRLVGHVASKVVKGELRR